MSKIAATPPTYVSLTQQVAREENRIATNFKKGLLTEGEAAEAKRALEGVKSELASLDTFDTSYGPKDLSGVAQMLGAQRRNITTLSQDAQLDSTKLIANLEGRIAANAEKGTLTKAQVEELSSTLDYYKGAFGQKDLTPEQIKSYNEGLKGLSAEVRTKSRDDQNNVALRAADFQERIADGLADGSLSKGEAARLTRQLENRTYGHGRPDDLKLNAMDDAIREARSNTNVNVNTTTANLWSAVDAACAKGKMTVGEANVFKAKLLAIKEGGDNAETKAAELNLVRAELRAVNAGVPRADTLTLPNAGPGKTGPFIPDLTLPNAGPGNTGPYIPDLNPPGAGTGKSGPFIPDLS